MKIVISESQYKNLTEGINDLSVEEMEKYMDVYFQSIERYEDRIKKFIQTLSFNKFKNVTFRWDPELNTNNYKTFAHRTYFSVNKNTVCFQFIFSFNVLDETYDGKFNRFITFDSGRLSIYPSINLTPLAFGQNYSKIGNYIAKSLKQPEFRK